MYAHPSIMPRMRKQKIKTIPEETNELSDQESVHDAPLRYAPDKAPVIQESEKGCRPKKKKVPKAKATKKFKQIKKKVQPKVKAPKKPPKKPTIKKAKKPRTPKKKSRKPALVRGV